jgi:hypothetical protein
MPLLSIAEGRLPLTLIACVLLSMSDEASGDTAVPPADQLPRCASRADVDRLHGQKVRVEGRYEVDPVPGGKKLQAATIVLDDRTRLLRSYRPVEKELHLVDRRVIVVGTVFRNAGQPAHHQQVMAPHVYPDSITLATGEKGIEPAPTELPAPPLVRTFEELERRDDRWVRLQLVLPDEEAKGEGMWVSPEVRLAGDHWVALQMMAKSTWTKLRGKEVTVFGRVSLAKSKSTPDGKRVHAIVAVDVCAGPVERWPGGR